ncbi:hypothetical protein [Dichotomicrobium thermohalophilum]|uniref:Uncharacterized protein n=1 Tax=Dichotomicrobium thermohalophilum TaxID=933063 RepID=A0A397Q4B2_9HYPH|nr:hypothetical protein [Dichotomicrobium thermohalophilum]RIA56350.1 hypothetical protein BXY53_1455 [Dichotomicrobium thermohalophilum]
MAGGTGVSRLVFGIYGAVVLAGMVLAWYWNIYWLILPTLAGLDMVLVAITGVGLVTWLARVVRIGR